MTHHQAGPQPLSCLRDTWAPAGHGTGRFGEGPAATLVPPRWGCPRRGTRKPMAQIWSELRKYRPRLDSRPRVPVLLRFFTAVITLRLVMSFSASAFIVCRPSPGRTHCASRGVLPSLRCPRLAPQTPCANERVSTELTNSRDSLFFRLDTVEVLYHKILKNFVHKPRFKNLEVSYFYYSLKIKCVVSLPKSVQERNMNLKAYRENKHFSFQVN